MSGFSEMELNEARRAIESALKKSEKALLKLKPGSWQYSMTAQGISAYKSALELIQGVFKAENGRFSPKNANFEEEKAFFEQMIGRVEAVLPKFAVGTAQHTLAVRRIAAFRVAIGLMEAKQR